MSRWILQCTSPWRHLQTTTLHEHWVRMIGFPQILHVHALPPPTLIIIFTIFTKQIWDDLMSIVSPSPNLSSFKNLSLLESSWMSRILHSCLDPFWCFWIHLYPRYSAVFLISLFLCLLFPYSLTSLTANIVSFLEDSLGGDHLPWHKRLVM